MSYPVFLLTFRTYGTWLHGDARGSVDSANREYGEPHLARDDGLLRRRKAGMQDSPFLLSTPEHRNAVADAIRGTCTHRSWELLALNVRTNHVHVVVRAAMAKERVLSDLKAWATRALREKGLADSETSVWAHHGSTRVLGSEAAVEGAIQYVLFEQGASLEG